MNTPASTAYGQLEPRPETSLDQEREASWLKSPYSAHEWQVTDSDSDLDPKIINFRYRLADGRCLTEVDRLYATVKEYAWFVRDARFSKIDTAQTHQAAVSQQMALAHALSLRGIPSYNQIELGDVKALVQDFRFGIDKVLRASDRLSAHIEAIEADPEKQSRRYKGFPLARTPEGHSKNMIDIDSLLAECNLPNSSKILPRVSWLIGGAARRNGMRPIGGREIPEEAPALSNVTKQQLQRSLDVLDTLHAIRHYAKCETPRFRPFPDGVMKVANQFGLDSQKTPVPPPKLVLHLLEASAQWVGEYAPPILSCVAELASSASEYDEDASAAIHRCRQRLPKEISQKLDESSGGERTLLNAVEMLFTACWVIVAAFSARRYEETVDLFEESLRGSDEDGWWLNCFISKTTRQREWIPVPLIVARAVQNLTALSALARANGAEGLFAWRAPPSQLDRWGTREISPRKLVNPFAAFVETPVHEDGPADAMWHWQPSQFRRFFAVLYFYRFEGADIAILSYFLRHFDIETTRGYVTRDPEAAKIWRGVEKDYTRRLADSIVSGEREVGGAMGERLKKLTKLITTRLEKHVIVTKELVGETLHHVMERGGLVVTPKAWVTCTCPRTQLGAKKAQCRQGQLITEEIVGPSFADAGPPVCNNCRWALKEPAKDAYACRTQTQLETSCSSESRAGTLFGELEEAHLVELRRVTPVSTGAELKPTGGDRAP